MEEQKAWRKAATWMAVVAGIISLVLLAPEAEAKSKRGKSSKSLPRAVAKAPVCDSYQHPKIMKVTPDPVKPGQKITIKGENFGSKACFKGVSFGRWNTKHYKYVNDSTLTATVPKLKPGLAKMNILTAGGSSEYILLVEKGKKSRKARKSKRSKRSRRR